MIRAKNYILFGFLAILLLCGCSEKTDIKKDTDADTSKNTVSKITGPRLEQLEDLYNDMDYDKVINKYSGKLPSGTTITRFRYYVIISGLDENTTYNLIDKDIRHTVDAMTKHYVSELPDSATPVFFFNDYDAYRDFSVKTVGIDETDLSPFGYYKISKNIIVVKYVSWKGSTSHEITHSLIQYDFPEIPSWFNEGLASLHEKYIYADGVMKGDFNWRILSLRRALREDTYTSIRKMMETNDEELYGKRSAFYYAQSRFLLMYIQQKDLLDDYYLLFKKTAADDPTGITQFEKTLNKPLEDIDKELVDYINSFTQQW